MLSTEYFTIDRPFLEAWASRKGVRSLEPAATAGSEDVDPGNRTVHFRRQRRSSTIRDSRTDPDQRLAKKGGGKGPELSYQVSVTMDNCHGLVVATAVEMASGTVEVEQPAEMLATLAVERPTRKRRGPVGVGKSYNTRPCVATFHASGLTPHVVQHITGHASALDTRLTQHEGYAISQPKRKPVQKGFG